VRAAAVGPGDYAVVATGKDLPALKCRQCGEITPMQNEQVVMYAHIQLVSRFLSRAEKIGFSRTRNPASGRPSSLRCQLA
jgi:hypothetical protein